jgi:hypothetical protein
MKEKKSKIGIKIELRDEMSHDKKEHNYQPFSIIKML